MWCSDLYGNEDGGDLGPTNDNDEPNYDEPEPAPTPAAAVPPKSAEKLATPAKSAPPPVGAPIQSYTTPLPSDPAPYPQGGQQIPTYQQPSNYEAKDAALANEDGYGGERAVRPSEMKDEG